MDSAFQLIVLLFSVIVHEVSHGVVALAYGDPTAKAQGRLTLNPVPHIDLFGTIILPLLLFVSNAGFIVGWAKPVPYNPYNLRNRKVAELMVALAGPGSNIILALVFVLLMKLGLAMGVGVMTIQLMSVVVAINLLLALFNLVPIPPLDGSKILGSLLPYNIIRFFEPYAGQGFLLLIIFILFFMDPFYWLYSKCLVFLLGLV